MFVYVDVISLKDSEISENKRIREIRAGRLSCLYNIDRNDLSFFFFSNDVVVVVVVER